MAQNTFRKNPSVEKNTSNAENASDSISDNSQEMPKISFLKDPRFIFVLGLFLIILSVFLTFSMISYPFTGSEDQSIVESLFETGLRDAGKEAENWLGLFGAVASYLLVFKAFGIVSVLFMPLLFALGIKIVFKKIIIPLRTLLYYTLFIVFWTSFSFGYIVYVTELEQILGFLSGAIGYEFAIISNEFLGIGTLLLIIFLMLVFLVYALNITSFVSKKNNDITDNIIHTKEQLPSEDLDNNIGNTMEDVEEDDEELNENDLKIEDWEIKTKNVLNESNSFDDLEIKIENQQAFVTPTQIAETKSTIPNEIVKEKPVEQEFNPENLPPYDPTLDLATYKYPTLDLMKDYGPNTGSIVSKEELIENRNKILNTLKDFGIEVTEFKATIGPTVTLYEIVPQAGIKISKIANLSDDIALRLSALGVRIIAPMPGKGTIGMEVPNKTKQMVTGREVLSDPRFTDSSMELPIAFGKTISNEVFVADLATMPHLLMAGATGMGKSVGINMLLTSLLYKKHPSQLKIVMVDPKKVELSVYSKIERHFLAKLPDSEDAIITDTKKVVHTLNSLCIEMDTRYSLLKDAGCRNLKEYNPKFISRKLNPNEGHRYLPYIVVVIDELADLMMTAGKEVEMPIARIAQLARAVGIHLVLATQRPSVNVITGVIKANFPARLSFRVTSTIDSRTILDEGGANQLIGKGDMLLKINSDLVRLQCAFVDTPEVENLVDYISNQRSYPTAYLLPEYFDENADPTERDVDLTNKDPKFNEAAKLIVAHQQGSTSLIQRKLALGYARSGRIMDQLEAAGIVGPPNGSKVRDVIIKDDITLQNLLQTL